MTTTDDPICDICGASATIHLVDTDRDTEHLYCSNHKPELPVGERSPRLEIKRFRLPPDNGFSQQLACPRNSAEHQMFRKEMCEDQLLGGHGACLYYLSIITGSDQFVLWDDQFVQNVRDYIISQTCEAASQYIDGLYSIQFLAGFFRCACERVEGADNNCRITKQERAIELLLNHPEWSDAQIAASVPTTTKQLQRWTDFTGLRAVPRRRNAT